MILDKADRKKSEQELKAEVEELKKMRNKDEEEIKLLKVEMNKLEMTFKKFRDIGGFQSSAGIKMPDRFIQGTIEYQMQLAQENEIVNTQQLLEEMNFVKNQLQCEIFKMKNQSDAKFDNFFKQRLDPVAVNTNTGGHTQSSIRLQINNLKTKCKILQTNIEQKDEEIAKLKQSRPQLGPEEKTKAELKRAYNILKTLRKRLRQNQIADGQH